MRGATTPHTFHLCAMCSTEALHYVWALNCMRHATRKGRVFSTAARARAATRGHARAQLAAADEAFHYTSGRWLYNESQRLDERRLRFDLPALARAVAEATGRHESGILSVQKLAEGGFNRVFQLTMDDGFQVIARLPYPSTQPRRLAVASEVATMDLVREHGVPVPRIYGYATDSDNTVGAEYILMEKVQGRVLGDVWFKLTDQQRVKVLSEIVENEAKLFGIDFPAYGSVFYEKDLPTSMDREALMSNGRATQFCIGPDASLKFWFEKRSELDIPRGPSMSPTKVLEAVAAKEMAWIRAHGEPRFPFDRVYRDITNFEKSDPHQHLHSLEQYMQVAAHLVPKDEWLHKPVIRHPDLNPNNIFISDNYDITGIIDWQHSSVLPLFLHAGIPQHLQNYRDPDSENLVKPELSAEIDEMDDEDRAKDLELYRRRHVHFYYVGATAKKLDLHFQALRHEGGLFRRKIYQHAGEPWEGNNVPLRADLVRLAQSWSQLATTAQDSSSSSSSSSSNSSSEPSSLPLLPCPLSFTAREAEEALEAMARQEEADRQMEILRKVLGVNVDGWVPHEGYAEAQAQAAEMKREAIDCAEDDFEREMTVRHWPFDDHDERE